MSNNFWKRVEDGLPEIPDGGCVDVFFMVSGYWPNSGYYEDGEDREWGRGFYDWESVWHGDVIAWAYVPPLEDEDECPQNG